MAQNYDIIDFSADILGADRLRVDSAKGSDMLAAAVRLHGGEIKFPRPVHFSWMAIGGNGIDAEDEFEQEAVALRYDNGRLLVSVTRPEGAGATEEIPFERNCPDIPEFIGSLPKESLAPLKVYRDSAGLWLDNGMMKECIDTMRSREGVERLLDRIDALDHSFAYSDDPGVFRRETEKRNGIKAVISQCYGDKYGKLEEGIGKYWNNYSRPPFSMDEGQRTAARLPVLRLIEELFGLLAEKAIDMKNNSGMRPGSIEVVNVRDLGGPEGFEKSSKSNVYIGRRPGGNILGNPFTHLQGQHTLAKYVVGSRDESVKAYEKYFTEKYGTDPEYTKAVDALKNRVQGGESIRLGCWCKPLSCHGDILKQKLEQMIKKDLGVDVPQPESAARPGDLFRQESAPAQTQQAAPRHSASPERTPESAPAVGAGTPSVTFEEDRSSYYNVRTQRNADETDMTVALAVDWGTAGEKCTRRCAENSKAYDPVYKREIPRNKYVAFSFPENGAPQANWAFALEQALSLQGYSKGQNIRLNVAGNGIYTLAQHGITQEQTDAAVLEAVKYLQKTFRITEIRSGGQTGIDEAGIKAAMQLGIPARVLAPKGWMFRDAEKNDIRDERAFKARFSVTPKQAVTQTAAPAAKRTFREIIDGAIRKGQIVSAGGLHDGWAVVRHANGKMNYSDEGGRLMTRDWFDSATEFRDGKATIVRGGTQAEINTQGVALNVKDITENRGARKGR